MDNVRFTAHITFVRHFGDYVPWLIYFVDVYQPDRQIIITLDMKDLEFSHDDLYFNQHVDGFPKTKLLRPANNNNNNNYRASVKPSAMKRYISNIYDQHLNVWGEVWGTPIGAIDKYTFDYLKKIIPYVVQLPSDSSLSEVWTEYAARQERRKNIQPSS